MPFFEARPRVLVLDVDGTLYRQGPLRRAMLVRLVRAAVANPRDGWRTIRMLRAYRHAQERLRGKCVGDVAAAQIEAACEATGADAAAVTACVARWIEREPLDALPACRYPGLLEFLQACRASGIRLAALSDYPAAEKLRALGIARHFELVLSAQDPEVGVFKPDPRGLHVAAERLGVNRTDCCYIGDRVEVDAAAAEAAGMRCAIVASHAPRKSDRHLTVRGYPQLQELIVGPRHAEPCVVASPETQR